MRNYIQYNANQHNEVIIAIPALGERKEMYAALAKALPEVHIVAIDLPGHNGLLDNDFSFKTYTKNIKETMDALKIAKAHFVGNSIGAWIIQNFYTNYRNLVKSLTLLDGGHYFHGQYHLDDEMEIKLPIIESYEDLQEAINEEIKSMGIATAEHRQYLYEYFIGNFVKEENIYRHHSKEEAINYLAKAVDQHDYCIETETPLPVLLLLADHQQDELLHRKLTNFHERQPTAKIIKVPNGFHFLPLTNPQEVAGWIRNTVLSGRNPQMDLKAST
ncbi:alpha/beta fold hydrolase [Lysinibacillus sp. NPDC093197]|uniref:alpha/beta fold hydrolase n=1 Tax=Lysinibacillus sp. NPDC093197 TaxID=3364132 RepID=UPI0037FA3A94